MVPRTGLCRPVAFTVGGCAITRYVGLDVSQKFTAICVVNDSGRRLWRGQHTSNPEQIERTIRRHTDEDARIGIKTGPMTP
jgi:transposase